MVGTLVYLVSLKFLFCCENENQENTIALTGFLSLCLLKNQSSNRLQGPSTAARAQ